MAPGVESQGARMSLSQLQARMLPAEFMSMAILSQLEDTCLGSVLSDF